MILNVAHKEKVSQTAIRRVIRRWNSFLSSILAHVAMTSIREMKGIRNWMQINIKIIEKIEK